MVNKYYTPELEEFHVGFEFESKYVLFSNNLEWKKVTLSVKEHAWFWDSYLQDAIETEFRVKYLDKEDIESLGWVKFDNHCYCITDGDGRCWYLWLSVNRLSINKGLVGDLVKDSLQIFRGEIKNKSELIKLMKQLNIK